MLDFFKMEKVSSDDFQNLSHASCGLFATLRCKSGINEGFHDSIWGYLKKCNGENFSFLGAHIRCFIKIM